MRARPRRSVSRDTPPTYFMQSACTCNVHDCCGHVPCFGVDCDGVYRTASLTSPISGSASVLTGETAWRAARRWETGATTPMHVRVRVCVLRLVFF